MAIECINSGSNKLITAGNVYEIISETEDRYCILNDKGIQKNYSKKLFKLEKEEILLVDEINVETFVLDNDGDITFKVIAKIEGFEDFEFEEVVATVSESTISCGIKEISGVDEMMLFVDNFEISFKNYILNEKINMDEDFDFDELFKEVKDSLLQDLISEFEGKCLYLLLSTNLTDNEQYNQKFIDSLNEVSEAGDLLGSNPNSGNDIKLWILQCN